MTQGAVSGIRSETWHRFGAAFIRSREADAAHLEPLSVFLGAGVVPRASRDDNHNTLGADLSKYLRVRPGDMVFNKLRTWQGGFGASAHDGVVSPAYFVSRPTGLADARFVDYLLHSAPYLTELTRLSKWMPPSQFDLAWEDLKTLPLALPVMQVQRRIADFLDDQVARFDEIIRLREEQVTAIKSAAAWRISEQVEDLGTSHGWTTMRRIMCGIEQGWSPQCDSRSAGPGEFGVLKLGAVRDGMFRETENKALPNELAPAWAYQVRPGDLLVSRANTPLLVGDVAVVPKQVSSNLFLPDLLYRVRLTIGETEFVSAALRTERVRGLVRVVARGTSQSMVKLRGEDIADLPIPLAPRPSRVAIGEQSTEVRVYTARLEREMRHQIDLLDERKRSLITAAVTGEFDVKTASGRGVA